MANYLKDELRGFVPKEQADEIIRKVARGSSVIRLSRVEPMMSDTKKIPVMTSGAGAYWVGEGQRISTSGATWIFPELHAKKLGVIIPVTKEKLSDSTIDVFAELKDSISEAFHESFDAAALFGYNSPFATNIMSAVNENGAVIKADSENYDLAASDVMAKVEEAGYDVDGFAAKIGVKNYLRKLRDSTARRYLYQAQIRTNFTDSLSNLSATVHGAAIRRNLSQVNGDIRSLAYVMTSSMRSLPKQRFKERSILTANRFPLRNRTWWQ